MKSNDVFGTCRNLSSHTPRNAIIQGSLIFLPAKSPFVDTWREVWRTITSLSKNSLKLRNYLTFSRKQFLQHITNAFIIFFRVAFQVDWTETPWTVIISGLSWLTSLNISPYCHVKGFLGCTELCFLKLDGETSFKMYTVNPWHPPALANCLYYILASL